MRNIHFGSVYHMPWLEYRYALPDGSVCLRLQTGRDEFTKVEARVTSNYDMPEFFLKAHVYPMQPVAQDEWHTWYQVTFMPHDRRLKYLFVLQSDEQVFKLDASGLHCGADYPEDVSEAFAFAYAYPTEPTPQWARGCVGYEIFPDRFRRGEGSQTDETLEPWTSDRVQNEYRFGGNLRGIIEAVPYLHDLGVEMVYTTPLFLSDTSHRYNTFDYYQVDPLLGTNEDFETLCKEAAKYGIGIVLDGVFSHTGSDSLYFNRYGRYDSLGAYQSTESPYYPWYTFEQYPDRYRTWWGFDTLPAVNKENADYQRYLLDPEEGILPRWVKKGACGWRLDVVDELPMPLVSAMRRAVKQADQEAVLLGEVWEDASNKVSYGALRSYCLGDSLDSVMNYPLRRAVIDFFTGKCDAQQLRRVILHQQEVYPAPFYYSLMNVLGSHDRVRILNAMAGYDQEGIAQMDRAEAAHIRLTPEQREAAQAKVLEAFRLLCALPGAPTVYYGDELGMEGMADPWNRAPMAWDKGDKAMRRALKKILQARQAKPMLQTGFLSVDAPDADTLIARRYAVKGRDVFGKPLGGRAVTVKISR